MSNYVASIYSHIYQVEWLAKSQNTEFIHCVDCLLPLTFADYFDLYCDQTTGECKWVPKLPAGEKPSPRAIDRLYTYVSFVHAIYTCVSSLVYMYVYIYIYISVYVCGF